MRPPEVEENDAGHDRWLVSYADFMTLMFAFFTVLYATSQKDVEKSMQFQESMKKFLVKAGGLGGGTPGMVSQGEKNNSPIEAPIETFRPQKGEATTGLDAAEIFIESKISKEDRSKYILDLTADDWGVRITLKSDAIFAPQSDKFRAEAMTFISKLSGLLTESKRKVMIEGHVAPSEVGPYKSTWEFASARSVNLLRFVQKKEALKGDRLISASFGDSRPIYEGAQAPLNSRLEVVLLNSDMEL